MRNQNARACNSPELEVFLTGVSGDAADGAAVGTDPPIGPTSASPFEARRCFALTFALLAIGTTPGLATIGALTAMDVLPGDIPVGTSEHSPFAAQTAANRFFQEERGTFAEGDFEAEYCVPETVYDPPSVLPTSAADWGPFGTHISTELGAHERAGFAALLEQHCGAFVTAPGNLTAATERHTPLRAEAVPVRCRAPRYSAEKREAVAEQCRIALEAGAIGRTDHNTSEWCSPALCVKKKSLGGSVQWRMCVDYRELNKSTVPDRYPIPTCDEQLNDLTEVAACNGFFSCFDLYSGFW